MHEFAVINHRNVMPFRRAEHLFPPAAAAHARLRRAGVEPLPYTYRTPGLAYHAVDTVCAWLILRFLVRPVARILAFVRELARSDRSLVGDGGGVPLRITPYLEERINGIMLGLFTVPGLRWSLAFVAQGRLGQATRLLAIRLVRLDVEKLASGHSPLAERSGRGKAWCLPLAPRLPEMAARLGA